MKVGGGVRGQAESTSWHSSGEGAVAAIELGQGPAQSGPQIPLQLATLDGAQQHLLFLGGGTGVIGGQ